MVLATIEFLDKSQTFFGVLVALLALMFYDHEGNIFHKILRMISEERNEELNRLAEAINPKKIFDNKDYKKIEHGAKSQDPAVKAACRTKLSNIKIIFNRDITTFQPATYKEYSDKILKWREVFLAPLFMFVFCLVIFVFDELLRIESTNELWFFHFLFWFLTITAILWIFLWGRYVYDAWKIRDIPALVPDDRKPVKEFARWLILLLIMIIIVSGVGLSHAGIADLLLFMAVVGICAIKGYFYARYLMTHGNQDKNLSYPFVFKHLGAIAIASVLCMLFSGCITDGPLNYEKIFFKQIDIDNNLTWYYLGLKLSVFGLVIVNGVFLPFTVPYYAMGRIRKMAVRQATEIKIKNDVAMNNMIQGFNAFVEKYHL